MLFGSLFHARIQSNCIRLGCGSPNEHLTDGVVVRTRDVVVFCSFRRIYLLVHD